MRRLRPSKIAITATVFVAMLGAACSGGMLKTLSGLNAIRNHLTEKYHDEVAVNLTNGRYLHIVFVNSTLNKMGSDARFERADDAARFVSRNYEEIKSIEQIWVSFVATETHFIIFHKTEGLGGFGFDNNGRPLAGNSGSENPLDPVVRFNQSLNTTDVGLTRIQLAGDMNNGLALVPHFTVNGDARKAQSAAPERVILDFASYAHQPVFTKSPEMEIYCDDKLIVKGPVRLLPSSASGSDETIAQFLTVQITFKSFQKMAAARSVKITLAAKPFELGPADINALSGMAGYARDSAGETNGG
jgi:hypothetical protein